MIPRTGRVFNCFVGYLRYPFPTMPQPKIFALSGSTRAASANGHLLRTLADWAAPDYEVSLFDGIATLPHFNPDQSIDGAPDAVLAFREQISAADGVWICTPEYVFSLPGSLKNALEWTVATTVFTGKPVGLITASASGEKGHEELLLIMRTLQAEFTDATQLLIKGIKGKFDAEGRLTDEATATRLRQFLQAFDGLLREKQ